MARQRIAFYGSTRAYWPVLEQHDLRDLGLKLHDMVKAGKWQNLPDEISDEVLALFAVIGRHETLASKVAERFAVSRTGG